MPDLPRQIRLAAGDYFMHGQDARMRQLGLQGNVCRVALRLDGGFNTALLRERVTASPMLNWLARVRITRPLPVFPAVWRTVDQPGAVLYEHDGPEVNGAGTGQLPREVMERDLHAGEGAALALDLVRQADDTRHLVLSWNHALMDVRGAELVLRHLNSNGGAKESPTMEDLINPDQMTSSWSRWWANVKIARGSMAWLRASGREPLFSLVPAGRPAGPCRGQCRVIPFSREETIRIEERCQRLNAGFRRSHFYLAASLRGLHTVASARGNKDGAYLAPVPHDIRKRGGTGPIFSNHLSILFYRIEPSQAVSLRGIIDELTRQMMDQVRSPLSGVLHGIAGDVQAAAVEFLCASPGNSRPGAKFASLCFSDSGESCAGMTGTPGRPDPDRHASGADLAAAGADGVILEFRRPSSRALLAWVDDCLSPPEVDVLEQGLRAALLTEEVP
jgi:hypothetical protein